MYMHMNLIFSFFIMSNCVFGGDETNKEITTVHRNHRNTLPPELHTKLGELKNCEIAKLFKIDLAIFHKGDVIRALIAAAGCALVYLPAYSPDFNPIEHW